MSEVYDDRKAVLDEAGSNCKKRVKEGVFVEARKILKKAYDDNLRVIGGVVRNREDPTICRQLYLGMTEEKPEPDGNRYMLCYTSKKMAEQDYALPEPYELLPVRFVIDNMRLKPAIGGLVFNRSDPEHSFFVPKAIMEEDPEDILKAMTDAVNLYKKICRE